MVAKVKSIFLIGLEAKEIEIQIHFSNGIPGLTIIGLAKKALNESKERVKAALYSLGIALPPKRILVNLAPADLEKDGSNFDLGIAIGILIEMKLINQNLIESAIVLGELSLDGKVESAKGMLAIAKWASQNNKQIVCPESNLSECQILNKDLRVISTSTLKNLLNYLGNSTLPPEQLFLPIKPLSPSSYKNTETEQNYDFANIKGQEFAKRACIIAACGGHNILLNGHPGTGKSMLASAFRGILPELNIQEIIEVTNIYSIAGLTKNGGIVHSRPHRAPHHSASSVAIIGGGKNSTPGEISLAHKGVLFLDELPEFERAALDSLREPLENGYISIARADYRIQYPARFQLFGTMNPCKCGHFGDSRRQCKKIPNCVLNYESKISGPILDRIDIISYVETESINFEKNSIKEQDTTEVIKKQVESVRKIQADRYKDEKIQINADLYGDLIEKYCQIDEKSQNIITTYSKKFGLSMRGYSKILKIARTIADIEGIKNINSSHILEALNYKQRKLNDPCL